MTLLYKMKQVFLSNYISPYELSKEIPFDRVACAKILQNASEQEIVLEAKSNLFVLAEDADIETLESNIQEEYGLSEKPSLEQYLR